MKIINAKEPHKEIYPKIAKINKFQIKFSLLFLPAYEKFIKRVTCKAFYFGQDGLSTINGLKIEESKIENEEYDDEEDFLNCEFKGYFPWRNYYFAILLDKTV